MRLRTLALLWLALATMSYAQTSAQPTVRPASASTRSAARFVSQNAVNAEVERALRQVVGQKNAIAAFEADIAARKVRMSGIAEDQQRVRENLKALKGSSEEKALVEQYARELNDQEDRVQSLQHEILGLATKARRSAKDTYRDD